MTPFCGPFVVCLWSETLAVAATRWCRSRCHELDRVVVYQEPVCGEGTDEPVGADDHPSFGQALHGLGQAVEAGTDCSTMAGTSMTRKSVTEGSP
jgi:hypothetical protein